MTTNWREQVVQILYETDQSNREVPAPLEAPAKALRIAEAVWKMRSTLDAELEAAAEHWTVSRMPVVDRNILRLGVWELRHDPDTPAAVVIDEAVEMAKTYSTQQSGSFVNGVLNRLAHTEEQRTPDAG